MVNTQGVHLATVTDGVVVSSSNYIPYAVGRSLQLIPNMKFEW
jgi:hypothetical protein